MTGAGMAPSRAADGTPESSRSHPDLLIAVLVGGVAAAIGAARIPLGLYDVAWAEDVNVFAKEAVELGPWDVLLRGYAGYQHLLPRVITALAMPAGLAPFAVIAAVVSIVLAGAAAGAVYWLARDVVVWRPARVALALLTVILPLMGQEVLGNLANLHTLCLWVLLFIVFCRFGSWGSAVSWGLVALVCVLTEVQSLIYLLLVPMLLLRRDRRVLPLVAALVIGAAAQLVTVFTVPRDARPGLIGPLSLVQGWLINGVLPLLNVDPGSVVVWVRNTGLIVPVLLLVPFAAAVWIVLARGTPNQRTLVITLCALSLLIYAAGAIGDGSYLFRYADSDAALWERSVNARYGVFSGLALAATVPLAASVLMTGPFRTRMRARRGVAFAGVVGLCVVFAIASVRTASQRELVGGPWSPSVTGSTEVCRGMDSATEVPLPVAPDRVVFLFCSSLLAFDAGASRGQP